MIANPPGAVRVALILARTSLRRWGNRVAARFRKKRKGRTGTARKGSRSIVALVFFGGWMLFASTNIAFSFVGRMDHELEKREAVSALPEPEGWAEAGHAHEMRAALGVVLTVLVAALFFSGLADRELAKPGWDMEWLVTFPASTRGLFLARIGEYALTNAFSWFLVLPFLVVAYWTSGLGALGIPLGLMAALYINVLVASLRVAVETWLRKRCGLRQLRNTQALGAVGGMLLLFFAFWLALSREPPRFLFDTAGSLSYALLWFPTSLPVLLASDALAGAGLVIVAVGAAWAATSAATGLVRDGLLTAGGSAYRGVRAPAAPAPPSRLTGMLGKEVRLLMRDRTFLVQTLLTPLFILGFQALVNPRLFSGAGGRSGAVLAYGVGAYVLMFGGFSVLAVERKSLWLLFTFPQPLARLLRRKTVLWGCVAAAYAVAALALAWRPGSDPGAAAWLAPVLALGGVFLCAVLASGLGVLATDPFEEHGARKVRQEWMWLYMILASMLGYGIYAESLWFKFVLCALFLLLGYGIWQKVEERLPLLLDPTQLPARALSLSDGLIATLVFFQLQHLFLAAFATGSDLPLGAQVALGYGLAGLMTVVIMLYVLWRAKIPKLGAALGYRGGAPPARALGRGVVYGLVAAGFGLVYLAAVDAIEPLRALREESMRIAASHVAWTRWTIAALVVVIAPLVEEFLFRGLVFRGLRRTTGVRTAIVLSALIFAIVHPPISFLPVFALGIVAAVGLERTRSLWTPVAAHAAYNAVMVLVASNLLD